MGRLKGSKDVFRNAEWFGRKRAWPEFCGPKGLLNEEVVSKVASFSDKRVSKSSLWRLGDKIWLWEVAGAVWANGSPEVDQLVSGGPLMELDLHPNGFLKKSGYAKSICGQSGRCKRG